MKPSELCMHEYQLELFRILQNAELPTLERNTRLNLLAAKIGTEITGKDFNTVSRVIGTRALAYRFLRDTLRKWGNWSTDNPLYDFLRKQEAEHCVDPIALFAIACIGAAPLRVLIPERSRQASSYTLMRIGSDLAKRMQLLDPPSLTDRNNIIHHALYDPSGSTVVKLKQQIVRGEQSEISSPHTRVHVRQWLQENGFPGRTILPAREFEDHDTISDALCNAIDYEHALAALDRVTIGNLQYIRQLDGTVSLSDVLLACGMDIRGHWDTKDIAEKVLAAFTSFSRSLPMVALRKLESPLRNGRTLTYYIIAAGQMKTAEERIKTFMQ